MSIQPQRQTQILHVDDEPEFTDLTTTFLERESDRFAVRTAHSAEEGLEKLNDRQPDCVVSDYNMPGMDGLEFLQAVREEYPDLPFILFTGKGSEEVASDAISAGATDYLQKQSGTEQYSLLANRVQNVVNRHQSEQRLRETRKEYTAVFENAQNALMLVTVEDDGFRYRQCNPRAVELVGRERPEIVGHTPSEALGPENGTKVVGAYRTCTEQGSPVEYTLTLDLPVGQVIRDGEVTPVTTNGEVEQLVVEFRDVTQQRQRQQELREYGTVIEALSDAVYVLDEDGRFTYVNDQFVELVGYDRGTILGNTPSLVKDGAAVEQAEHRLGQLLSGDGPDTVTFEVTIQPRDGDPVVCEDRMSVLPYDGDRFDGSVGTLRDITDRMERERELAQTRDLMANMEQLADVGAWEYDPDAETLLMTGGVCRVHGFEPDADPTLAEAFGSFRPDDRDRLRDRFDTCLETGEPYEVDVRLTTPDGGQKWVTACGERVTADGGGSVVRGYTRDITEQERLERALKQERDLVSGIVETVPVGLSVVDGDGSISFVNERLESICGRSPEELEEMPHDDSRYDLVDEHGEPLESGETPFNRVASRETTIHNQVVGIRRPSGERVWLSVSGAPQYDDGGELERAVFALEDITDRRELEREFTQIKTLAESLNDAVYVIDDDGRFTYINDEFVELTGYSKETVLGSTPDLIKDGETVEEAEQQLGMLLSDTGPDTVTFETTIQPDSGSPVVCEDHMGVLPYEGDSFNGSVGVLRDITERKRRERELRRERDRLDEFASVVSHDLRNPLTVADGRLELAQETCESPHLAQAADAVDRSQALIEDLLTLAREGEDVSEVEPVAFADVAERSWQTVETRSATLETHATQPLQADRSRLTQLFENLYRNAIEHGGDDVTVSVGRMNGGFYLADTGPGVPESDCEEIFEAGYSTDEDGTGFGLRIVEQVADAHGWDVAVTESEQGGARFEVTGVEFADS